MNDAELRSLERLCSKDDLSEDNAASLCVLGLKAASEITKLRTRLVEVEVEARADVECLTKALWLANDTASQMLDERDQARAECEAMRGENERLRASGSAPSSDSPGMTNNELTIKLQLSETRERQATEMCTWLTQENERLRNALKLADLLDAEVDELLDDSEEAVVQNAQLEHDVLVLKSALHVANAERDALAAEVERYRALLAAPCETEVRWHNNGRGPRVVFTVGREEICVTAERAKAIGAALLRTAVEATDSHTPKAGKP